jgi:hypothetical protein
MSGGIMGITNVAYVFGLKNNLFSIGTKTKKGYIIMFDAKECLVIHKQDRQVAITGT